MREWSRNPFGSILSPEIRWSVEDAHLDWGQKPKTQHGGSCHSNPASREGINPFLTSSHYRTSPGSACFLPHLEGTWIFQRLSLFRTPRPNHCRPGLGSHRPQAPPAPSRTISQCGSILFTCACVSPNPASARGPTHEFRALATCTCTCPASLLRPSVSLTCAVSSPLGQDTGLEPKMGSHATLSRTLLGCHEKDLCIFPNCWKGSPGPGMGRAQQNQSHKFRGGNLKDATELNRQAARPASPGTP